MGNCLGILRRTGVRRRLSRRVRPTQLQQIQPRPAPPDEAIVAESPSTTSLREPSPSRGDGNEDSVVSKTGVIPAIPTGQTSPQVSPTSASSSYGHHVPTGYGKGLSVEPLTPVIHDKKDSDVAESSRVGGAEDVGGVAERDEGGDGRGGGGD